MSDKGGLFKVRMEFPVQPQTTLLKRGQIFAQIPQYTIGQHSKMLNIIGN